MGYIEMRNSCKTYKMGETKIYANRDVSFSIEKGELAIILVHPAPENPRRSIS